MTDTAPAPLSTGRRRALLMVSAVLPILVAGQALAWVRSYYPRTDREAFYPVNPTQEFLAARLGHDRYYGADGAIFGSVDTTVRLRSYDGHAFLDKTFAQLADSLPGQQFHSPTTTITSDPAFAAAAAVDPVLDRSAVRYFVTPPEVAPFGQLSTARSDGSTVDLAPGTSVTVPISTTGGLRGIGVIPIPAKSLDLHSADAAIQADSTAVPAESAASSAHLRVTVRDTAGTVVATNERQASTRADDALSGGTPWMVALAGQTVPAGTPLTAEITALGSTPLRVAGTAGRPAVATVTAVNDGLRLVYAQESVIYERTRALPRARWASATTIVSDPAKAVDMLSTATVSPNTVVLSTAGPAASGLPGTVTWVTDGLDSMTLSVRAEGAGYLVLADAIQHGWKATVDGVGTPIASADYAYAAVAVPAGTHTVRFTYTEPFAGPGFYTTGLTVFILFAILGVEFWRHKVHGRRRARRASPTVA